ncbi:protein TIC 20-v, chloroplastic [Cryptomeria japonica]|uniref:protein TIC 20-v, chloroplastic n=1 Tax=Cryptomeria japonica TaxID=3369 RepID=UPI0027DA0F22|nr:protein TIC 20-v, chloroplastic [Cryptomeria japonica]XP_057862415.2 protein TIC 20-v, chloroplastic [Cryptomeria japonica]XP_057862416.2 protein TIC 20-v, chloroplastic [Cryptomeria japonica]
MAASLSLAASSLSNLHSPKISTAFVSTAKFLSVGTSSRSGFDFPILKKSMVVLCSGNNNNTPSVPAADRLIAAVGYFLPFFDGVQYGRFFLTEFPSAQLLLEPLLPAIRAYRSFPFASILVFFVFYFSVVRNPNLSRYVRFNVMQAIVLDVILIFPELVDRSFGFDGGLGLSLLISFDNTVFLFLLTCLVYGSSSCLLGQAPRLPLVADAADSQVL